MSKITDIQKILEVEPDDIWGPKSQAAFDALIQPVILHKVKASSFADPADVSAFWHCKAQGKSDKECLKVGDNGIGKWGDATTANVPMVALPPEDWKWLGKKARGAKVRVLANGFEVICELRDTMPPCEKIANGAGIDLNFAACTALGLKPPIMVSAMWQWA